MAPGINTTGKPNTLDYNLGRGALHFASLSTTGYPLGFRHLGNASAFAINLESESIEHQSSRTGLKKVDKEVIISQKAGISMTLEELNFQNIALFLSGTFHDGVVNEASSSVNADTLMYTAAYKGFWYDLIDGVDGGRLYDVYPGEVIIEAGDSSSVGSTLTQGTDYTLDAKMGRIFIEPDGNFVDGDSLYLSYTSATTVESTLDQVRGLTKTSVAGALKFISKNPVNSDKQTEFEFHQVTLKAEGDFNLIGDEFTEMQLTGTAEANDTAFPNSPVVTITTHARA